MSNPYRAIFRPPGTRGFAAAAFLARLPIAMAAIGIITMLSQTHGAYGLAGAVSATFALANALLAPQLSRLIDRLGQTRVAAPATAISVLAFAVLVWAAHGGWPTWTLFAAALPAALMPSMPALVRARWTALFRDRPELNTAFAFESIADELMYIVGASLSVGLSVAWFPGGGVLVSTVFLALGTTAFLMQRATEPPVSAAAASAGRSAFAFAPVRIVTLALIFVGAIFATAEVSVVAVTRELGRPGAASLVIGVYAAGSLVVGLIMGAMALRMAPERRLVIAVAVIALTALPLPFAGSVAWLAFAIFVSGLGVSPTFITAFGLIERRIPPTVLTEGITWVMTGIGIGMALGAFVAGWVVDSHGASNGFWVAVVAGVAALLTVLLGQRALGAPRHRGAVAVGAQAGSGSDGRPDDAIANSSPS